MTEIVFYQLQRQPLERVLPTLIEKSLERGWRVIVQAASEERVEALDAQLSPERRGRGPFGPFQAGVGTELPITSCDAQINERVRSRLSSRSATWCDDA